MVLETSVDLRSSQAWSQFDGAMSHWGGADTAGAPPLTAILSPVASDDEVSDSGQSLIDEAYNERTPRC